MTDKETKPKKTPKRPDKAAAPDKFIKVTLVRSPIGYPRVQRLTATGLGLRRLQSHAVLKETPAVLGMVRKIGHLLKVESVEKP
jgi:large subunit ribosomal protein L30